MAKKKTSNNNKHAKQNKKNDKNIDNKEELVNNIEDNKSETKEPEVKKRKPTKIVVKKSDRPTAGELMQKEFIEKSGISQGELAEALFVPTTRINQLARNQRKFTVDTDLRMTKFFKLKKGFFLNYQLKYEMDIIEKEIADDLDIIGKNSVKKVIKQRIKKQAQLEVRKRIEAERKKEARRLKYLAERKDKILEKKLKKQKNELKKQIIETKKKIKDKETYSNKERIEMLRMQKKLQEQKKKFNL